jgi:hypothetical protein
MNPMATVKFGTSQLGKPSPQSYRYFSNAMIIFILPGLAALISGWGFSKDFVNHCLLLLTFGGSAIKGIGTLLGNGQYYTSQPKAADDQSVVMADKQSDTKPDNNPDKTQQP